MNNVVNINKKRYKKYPIKYYIIVCPECEEDYLKPGNCLDVCRVCGTRFDNSFQSDWDRWYEKEGKFERNLYLYFKPGKKIEVEKIAS